MESKLAAMRGNTQLVASWLCPSNTHIRWDTPKMREIYERAAHVGDIVKLVNTARSPEDNLQLQEFYKTLPSYPPVLLINSGIAGQLSRLLNRCLNPVTHAALPASSVSGLLTIAEVQLGRRLMGLLQPRTIHQFGAPVAYSLAQVLHTTGFHELGLPH